MGQALFFTRTVDCQDAQQGTFRYDFQCTTESGVRGNLSLTMLVMLYIVMFCAVMRCALPLR